MHHLIEARFIAKKNRFVGLVSLGGSESTVYIPNTGRLSELLLPGSRVLVSPHHGKHPYKLLYAVYKGKPVFIDSIASNSIFADLIRGQRIPGWEDIRLIRREPAFGAHRFDFLMRDGSGKEFFVELKSCTLAWKNTASFPDAPTERGVAHVKALAESGRGRLVFLILHSAAEHFIPDYHTHFEFHETLLRFSGAVDISAYSACYDEHLRITGVKRAAVHIPEVRPSGGYMLVFRNPSRVTRAVGVPGEPDFPEGYYVYTGNGMGNLFARISHHRKKRITPHRHIDYLKRDFILVRELPVVSPENIGCSLAGSLEAIGGARTAGFGSTDCGCPGHLVYFRHNPLETEVFWDMVLEARFGNVHEL